MSRDRLMFYLGEHPVGRFWGRAYPTAAGRVEYDPYRGEGHQRMAATLRRGEAADCWFVRRGRRVSFVVIGEEFIPGRPGSRSKWYVEVLGLGAATHAEPSAAPDRDRKAGPGL
jgi:hypothetical protein